MKRSTVLTFIEGFVLAVVLITLRRFDVISGDVFTAFVVGDVVGGITANIITSATKEERK